jgi:D-3-phosphoglycerate dehydrogenase
MTIVDKPRRVLITEPRDFSPRATAILGGVGEVVLQEVVPASLPAAFSEFDVVWVRLGVKISAATLGPSPRCRLLVVSTTGLDHIDLEACRQRGVRVVSLQGEVDFLKDVRATAELTLALALALLRRVPQATKSVMQGEWSRDQFRGREVFEKTVGIVGVGRLGAIAARYFGALGAKVLGYDPRSDFPHEVARRVGQLTELLSETDIVCIMARYEAGTRHLLGRDAFACMKPDAVLINTARGGIIDEGALVEALDSGRLAGAALDVLDGEPEITANHPLVRYAATHDNLLITPHLGGNTLESFAKTELFLAEKVKAILQSQ